MNVSAARINSDEKFSLVFSLSKVTETNHLVARQEELAAMQKTLGGGTGRRAVLSTASAELARRN